MSYTERLARLVYWTLCISGVFMLISMWPTDSTDVHEFNRSGMGLHRDALTGCEYLSGARGGLTPRMTSAGIHMGCRP